MSSSRSVAGDAYFPPHHDVCRTLVGHSERRHIVGESNALSAEKAILALGSGLGVVFCVGETLEEREAGKVRGVCGVCSACTSV